MKRAMSDEQDNDSTILPFIYIERKNDGSFVTKVNEWVQKRVERKKVIQSLTKWGEHSKDLLENIDVLKAVVER